MSITHGMDPDQVEQLGGRINSEAQNLQALMTKLDGLVQSMQNNWKGTDSDRFATEYTGQYRGQINAAVQQLEALSQTAIRNANEQRQTSGS